MTHLSEKVCYESYDAVFGENAAIESLECLPPLSDIAQELFQITGKHGPAELSDVQVSELSAYGRVVARHERQGATILVICDDLAQHLVVIKSQSAPHFAFIPN
jgi:hypothetical protein